MSETTILGANERICEEFGVGLRMIHGAAWIIRFKTEDIAIRVYVDL